MFRYFYATVFPTTLYKHWGAVIFMDKFTEMRGKEKCGRMYFISIFVEKWREKESALKKDIKKITPERIVWI